MDSPSLVDDESQSDTPSVIRDGWQLDESTRTWYYGINGKHQTGWLKSGGYWYWLDPANDLSLIHIYLCKLELVQ